MVSDSLITGFMVSSSAFITVTGIALVIGRERFGKKSSASLLISLFLGVAVIVTSLSWFSNTPNSALTGWILISLQIITFYIPLFRLTSLLSNGGDNMPKELTDSERAEENIPKELTAKEQKEYKKLCDKVTAMHAYIEGLNPPWMDDAERFIALNALHTQYLSTQSKRLNILTWVLSSLTLANVIFLIISIFT